MRSRLALQVGRGPAIRTWAASAVLGFVVLFGSAGVRADFIDQANVVTLGQMYNISSSLTTPIGQEFTPTFGALDFVDLFIEDAGSDLGPGAQVQVRIRQDSITGTVLGTSLTTFIPDGTNTGGGSIVTRFAFSAPVTLDPGATHVLEVVQTGSIVIGNSNFMLVGGRLRADTYSGGRAVIDGVPVADFDFYFREGLTAVPEPASVTLVGLGLLGLVGPRLRRRAVA